MKIRLNVTMSKELYEKMQDFNIHNPENRNGFSFLLSKACNEFLENLGAKPQKDRIEALSKMVMERNRFIEESDKIDEFEKWKKENDIQTI
jgi:hypothetical protein